MTIPRPIDNDFADWAFGVDVWDAFLLWEIHTYDLLLSWNKLHSEHSIDGNDSIEDSLEIMMNLYKESQMDKKMHKVTEKMQTAEGAIKKGEPKKAIKALKGAEKKNEKLVKIDKDVRDPLIKECKASMKKGAKS